MKLAIIGSREKFLADPAAVRKQVTEYVASLPPGTVIVSGGARGVDSYAAEAARLCGHVLVEYLPDWDTHGNAAGFVRNRLIIDQADRPDMRWLSHYGFRPLDFPTLAGGLSG